MSDTEKNAALREGEVAQESMEEFKKRVKDRTGMDFDNIPKGEEKDALHHIFCRRGDVYVVGVDAHPEQDEDGNEMYNEFRVVDLSAGK